MQNLDNSPQSPQQVLTTMRILWLALCVSMGLLVFIVFRQRPYNLDEGLFSDFSAPLEVPLTVIALCVYIVGTFLSRFFLAAAKKKENSTDLQKTQSVFVPMIVYLALNESAVMLGFAIAMGSEAQKILPFFVISIYRNLMVFPRSVDSLKKVLERGSF